MKSEAIAQWALPEMGRRRLKGEACMNRARQASTPYRNPVHR